MPPAARPRVTILLATYNGARFLAEQLDSFLTQTVRDWRLLWRDDGSTDETVAIMEAFTAGPAAGRAMRVEGAPGWLGPTATFMTLLRAAPQGQPVAFADQDDVWLPEKLALGLAAIAPQADPTLYCSRQLLVDENLRVLSPSAPLRQQPGFPAALTQNIATGCTVMLNPAAVTLIAQSHPPSSTLHDWWSYLVISSVGGTLIMDPTPTVLYRQHGANMVGAPRSAHRRALAALIRGPDSFMNVFRGHVAALRAQPTLTSPNSIPLIETLHLALHGGWAERRQALRLPGFIRQAWVETMLFRWWFLLG